MSSRDYVVASETVGIPWVTAADIATPPPPRPTPWPLLPHLTLPCSQHPCCESCVTALRLHIPFGRVRVYSAIIFILITMQWELLRTFIGGKVANTLPYCSEQVSLARQDLGHTYSAPVLECVMKYYCCSSCKYITSPGAHGLCSKAGAVCFCTHARHGRPHEKYCKSCSASILSWHVQRSWAECHLRTSKH